MEASILNTTKKLLGVDPSYDSFDTDITVFINSSLGILNQLGVGPDEGFSITGATETWDDYLPDDPVTQEMAKTYIYLKTRLAFDPPQVSRGDRSDKGTDGRDRIPAACSEQSEGRRPVSGSMER